MEQFTVLSFPDSLMYLEDEASLSQKSGVKIESPVRLFDLRGLSLDKDEFISHLAPTFEKLEWDYYDVLREQARLLRDYYAPHVEINSFRQTRSGLEFQTLTMCLPSHLKEEFFAIKPYRRRSIARFVVEYDAGTGMGFSLSKVWNIKRVPVDKFVQSVGPDDHRSLARVFPEMSEGVVRHPEFAKLVGRVADMVKSVRPDVTKLTITAHQVGTVARPGRWGDNAPEGTHQDGADYIVSAIEVEQKGSRGAVSVVYGPDKKTKYLEIDLGAGQGIFQADSGSPLWHDVSPLFVDYRSGSEEGVRNTFGFDIKIESA